MQTVHWNSQFQLQNEIHNAIFEAIPAAAENKVVKNQIVM